MTKTEGVLSCRGESRTWHERNKNVVPGTGWLTSPWSAHGRES